MPKLKREPAYLRVQWASGDKGWIVTVFKWVWRVRPRWARLLLGWRTLNSGRLQVGISYTRSMGVTEIVIGCLAFNVFVDCCGIYTYWPWERKP